MNSVVYTDDELATLKAMPKRVANPGARWQEKPSATPTHRQRNLQVIARAEPDTRFAIYQRQNAAGEIDFVSDVRYCPLGGTPIVLARYNGPSHVHHDIAYRPHIHRTTEEAILAGQRPESKASETDRYTTLEGATACLLEDYNVSGMSAKRDAPRLIP